MAIEDSVYKVLYNSDEFVEFEEIVDAVQEEYSGASALDVRKTINELKEEYYVEQSDDGFKFREYR